MTFPIDVVIGNTIIPSHLIFDILSMYAGFQLFAYLANRKKDILQEKRRWIIIVAAGLGALVGSRLIAALEHPELFFNPPSLLYYYQNKTILGALVGGVLAVEITKLFLKEKKRTGDLFTYPLIFGMIVGRIGCALTGVKDGTVGLPSLLPWAFDQGDGLARHPTALYEIVFLVLLWIALHVINKKIVLNNGILFRFFIIAYCSFRFFMEFIKPVEPLFAGLSAIQIASLITAIIYAISTWRYGIRQNSNVQLQHGTTK